MVVEMWSVYVADQTQENDNSFAVLPHGKSILIPPGGRTRANGSKSGKQLIAGQNMEKPSDNKSFSTKD